MSEHSNSGVCRGGSEQGGGAVTLVAVDETDSVPENGLASWLDVQSSGPELGSTMGSEMGKGEDESEEGSMAAKIWIMQRNPELKWKLLE